MFGSDSPEKNPGMLKGVLVTLGAIYLLASIFLMFEMRGQIGKLENGQAKSAAQVEDLSQRLDAEVSNLRANNRALGAQVGLAERKLQTRTTQLRRQQTSSISKLRKEQQEQLEGVRKENKEQMDGVRTEVASTRSDLDATKQKLDRTIGDLGVQSGLIAHTREDLELLKRRGERNYYEFTLVKGRRPQPVSTVSLQLKRTNPKRSKYTLNVVADDRVIEKKDRTAAEPLQFYSGRDRQLYEVVVWTVEKNKVTGYLSTPKSLIAQAQ